MTKIFLSYSHADSDWVESLAEELRAHGVDVLSDPLFVNTEKSFDSQLRQAIRKSKYFIVVVNEGDSNPPLMAFELGAALGMEKEVVPVVPPNVPIENLVGPIRSRQYLVKTKPDIVAQQLLNLFEKDRSQTKASA